MDRFWSKVDRTGAGCWEWTASRFKKGYGRFNFQGRVAHAHRTAYELTHGPIPPGMLVCHTCDNPPCCNPSHLFLGSHSDNAVDMIQKRRHWFVRDPGRRALGEAAHRAKLTEGQVAEIFKLRSRGMSQRAIGESVGISPGQVGRIVRGENWAGFAGRDLSLESH